MHSMRSTVSIVGFSSFVSIDVIVYRTLTEMPLFGKKKSSTSE